MKITSKETKLRKTVVAQLKDISKLVGSGKLGEYRMEGDVAYINAFLQKLGPTYITVVIDANILT